MPSDNTLFEPLWLDSASAIDELARKQASGEIEGQVGECLRQLIEFGYAIIPNAISHQLADDLAEEIAGVVEHPEYFIARRARQAYAHPNPEIYQDRSFRLIDYHVNSALAREAIFAPTIVNVLKAAFNASPNAFQCLTFNYGSQQALHQDGAYVVVAKPLQFMASWIALEDVTPGSGELQYYTGSHKLEDFLFPDNSKCWIENSHGPEVHQEFLRSLPERCTSAGLALDSFLPKKGDALIWASDLVHGGSKITSGKTRRSMVAHYCPSDVKPNFSKFTDYFHLQPGINDCFISSRHYDLRPAKHSLLDKILRKPAPATELLRPSFMGHLTDT